MFLSVVNSFYEMEVTVYFYTFTQFKDLSVYSFLVIHSPLEVLAAAFLKSLFLHIKTWKCQKKRKSSEM